MVFIHAKIPSGVLVYAKDAATELARTFQTVHDQQECLKGADYFDTKLQKDTVTKALKRAHDLAEKAKMNEERVVPWSQCFSLRSHSVKKQ